MKKVFIALDGGGSKSEVVLVDLLGHIHFRKVVSCCNPNDVGIDKSIETIINILKEFKEYSNNHDLEIIEIFLLIAGIEFGDLKRTFKERISKELDFDSIFVDGDLLSVKEAGLVNSSEGVVVISGTGFNLAIKHNNQFVNVGGWGYLGDDYFCGFDLGKDAIKYSALAINGVGKETILVDLLENHYNHTLWYSMEEIYKNGIKGVASLSKFVIEAYQKGDKVAKTIIDKRLRLLAKTIKKKTSKFAFNLKVCLFGGIFENNYFLVDKLQQLLGTNYNVCLTDKKTIYGAVYLASEMINGSVSEQFSKNFDLDYRRNK